MTHPLQGAGQEFDDAAFAGFDFSGNGHAGADGNLFAVNPEHALVQCEGGGVVGDAFFVVGDHAADRVDGGLLHHAVYGGVELGEVFARGGFACVGLELAGFGGVSDQIFTSFSQGN